MHRLHSGPARHLPALLGYTLLTLLLLAPVLPHFASAIPGGVVAEADGWQNVWNLWWVYQAVGRGLDPLVTPYLFYPDGANLHLQTLNASNGVLVLPVTALFGPVAAYNSALLLAFVLAGMGGYALALHVSGSRVVGFVAGLVLTFAPFHLTKLWDGQLELVALQWTPFYVLLLLRVAEGGPRRDRLLAGGCLALIGYTSWYYLLFFALYSILFALLWLPWQRGTQAAARYLLRLGSVAGLAGLLLLPLLLPALADAARGGAVQLKPHNPYDPLLIHSANLFDILLPSNLHPLWGETVRSLGQQWHPYTSAWNIAPGYTLLALAGLGALLAWRAAWRWWLVALLAWLLALGPLLHIGAARTALPLPYMLLLHLPGVGLGARPNHLILVALLAWLPPLALALRALLARSTPHQRGLVLAGVLALLAVDYWPPRLPLQTMPVHPYHARLRDSTEAVLTLPPLIDSSRPMIAQITHERPILGGYVSRIPAYPFVQQTPGVQQLWAMEPRPTRLLDRSADGPLVALNFYGVRHILVQHQQLGDWRRRQLAAALAQVMPDATPAYQDARLTAYVVPEVPPRSIAFFAQGWHAEETNSQQHWRWMAGAGTLTLLNPAARPEAFPLRLALHGAQADLPLHLALNGQPLDRWQLGPAGQVTRRTLRLWLPPGAHTLHLTAPTITEAGSGRQISLALLAEPLP